MYNKISDFFKIVLLPNFRILYSKPIRINSTYKFSVKDKRIKCFVDNTKFGRTIGTNYFQNVRLYSTVINNSSKNCKNDTNKTSLFTNPKNVLHNCFDVLSHDLKQKDLRLIPTFKTVINNKSSLWMCTYNLKWPEAMKFTSTASTKKEASTNAAVNALMWLLQNKKISNEGQPIIYGKEEVLNMKSHVYPLLEINSSLLDLMDKTLSDDGIKTFFSNYNEEKVNTSIQIEEEWPTPFLNQSQRLKDLNFYTAKESKQLPISSYKDTFINMLKENNVLIVKGEPACGKSTRAPQYVLEGWAKDVHLNGTDEPCRIVVTEPRRIAAISLAERVANERKESIGSTVGFHVRLKSNFNKLTGRILYCTTGILLRHIQCDPKLRDVTHVIVDEAHERDVNVDLLLNLLHHSLKLNSKLKIIIMSATIDAKEFQRYFYDAPILNIPGFVYPVDEHYLTDDYPKTYEMCKTQYANVVHEDVASCINRIHKTMPEGAILCFLPGWDDIMKVKDLIPLKPDVYVLCLHSRLDLIDQKRIFSVPPPGVRKIILSTNIAETSVTIDDVVYVVDTGIHKEQRFDVEKGVMCIDNHWISKASATQRKGRAGRCQSGKCFRLYPKSRYEEFVEFSLPEILRTSLTKIILDTKVYSNNMNAAKFLEQLICPPDLGTINKAVEELKELELLDENEDLTPLGRSLSNFQLPPKLSKAMVNAIIFKCVTPIVDIVTLYSTDSALFSKALVDKESIKRNMESFSKTSDHLAMMNLFEKWLYYVDANEYSAASEFCDCLGIVQSKLRTLKKLRNIHFDYLYRGLHDVLPISDDFSDNYELVKGVLLSGVGNVLQQRSWNIVKGRFKNTNVLITRKNQKATITSDSVNSRKSLHSRFLIYINEVISNLRHTTLVRETSSVSPVSVLLFMNSKLVIKDTNDTKDQVLIKLDGTNIGFLCSKKEAETMQQYKEVLNNFRKYYTHQLTAGQSYNSTVNKYWQDSLKILNEILNRM